MERRKYLRYPVYCPVVFSRGRFIGTGTLSSVSRSGWKIASNKSLPIGASATLRIFLSDGHPPLEVIKAVVRWAQGREFGLELLHLLPEERERLRRFVTRLESLDPLETAPSHDTITVSSWLETSETRGGEGTMNHATEQRELEESVMKMELNRTRFPWTLVQS